MATCSGTVTVGKVFNRCHVGSLTNSPIFIPWFSAVTIEDKNTAEDVKLRPIIKGSRSIVSGQRNFAVAAVLKAEAAGGDRPISAVDDDDGVLLGTLKLPGNTDLARFETLLFQWANSLCQGSNLPMPMPLKVDKIAGGARIGFITIGDGESEVSVYIDCLVFPSTEEEEEGSGSGPIFRAIRNGARKAEAPPGEPRIMRSLLAALKKSVQLATL